MAFRLFHGIARWLAVFALLALALAAAGDNDLAGTWQYQRQLQNGSTQTTTYVFKVSGNSFTGTVANTRCICDITDGTINGSEITFSVPNGYSPQQKPAPWKGTLGADGLTLEPVVTTPAVAGRGIAGRGPMVAHKVSSDTEFRLSADMAHAPLAPFKPIAANGLAMTPPMGWNSWNKFAGKVDDKAVRSVADAMVASGMRDAGYVYVNIDDTWEGDRDPSGNIQSNEKFPDMKALAEYVHSKGLKLGIYSSPGPKTCAGFEGSYKHEAQDAKSYAAWGIDYLKYDWCSASEVYRPEEMPAAYELMASALRSTGRPIVFSLCEYGWEDVGTWGTQAGGNLWRTTGDISDNWRSMSANGFNQVGREVFAAPGHWNDPDMLEVGNGGMTDTEYQTHLSLWAMLAAPLIAGNDIAAMTPDIKAILTNPEVIAIDQDKLGKQGTCALNCTMRGVQPAPAPQPEVWLRQLSNGNAVALFNRTDSDVSMTVKWSDLHLKDNPKVRDLWKHLAVAAPMQFSATVPAHGTVMLLVQ